MRNGERREYEKGSEHETTYRKRIYKKLHIATVSSVFMSCENSSVFQVWRPPPFFGTHCPLHVQTTVTPVSDSNASPDGSPRSPSISQLPRTPIPKVQAWPLLKRKFQTTIEVRGVFAGYRMRKCKSLSEKHGSLQPLITLAPVWIGDVLVDHLHIDLSPYLHTQIGEHQTSIGDHCLLIGTLTSYKYTNMKTHRSHSKIGLSQITHFSSLTPSIPEPDAEQSNPQEQQWSDSQNQHNLRHHW